MTIYGAMFSGVSGLAAQSQSIGMIADNISNVNTVGYKRTRADFFTFVTASAGPTSYSPGGVQSRPNQLIDRQGLLTATDSPTDLAISGDGFFIVNTSSDVSSLDAQYLYTRSGSFTQNNNGNLVNAAGHFLQAWPYDANGNLPTNLNSLSATEAVNVANLTGTAAQTTSVTMKGNLQSTTTPATGPVTTGQLVGTSPAVTPDFQRSATIFDSQGGEREIVFSFRKDLRGTSTPNTWYLDINTDAANLEGSTDGLLASMLVTFGPDGTPASTGFVAIDSGANVTLNADNTFSINIAASGTGGATPEWETDFGIGASDIQVDLNSFTQFDAPSQLLSTEVDGSVFGGLSGVEINDAGDITAIYTNGVTQKIYRIPLANFPNVNGLIAQNGNAFQQSDASGLLNMATAKTAGTGSINANSLESSTVDLATEFSTMIITQRAYSASGKIITTADEMLEELLRIKR